MTIQYIQWVTIYRDIVIKMYFFCHIVKHVFPDPY